MFKNFGANFVLFLMSDTFIFTITHLLHQAQMARQAEQDLMSLYIVNLPHSVKESDIKTMFSPYGQVIIIIILRLSSVFTTRWCQREYFETSEHLIFLSSIKISYLFMMIRWCQRESYETRTSSLEVSDLPGWRVVTSVNR